MLRLLAAAVIILTMPMQSFEASIKEMPFDFNVMPQAGQETLKIDLLLRNKANYPLSFEFGSLSFMKWRFSVKKAKRYILPQKEKHFYKLFKPLPSNRMKARYGKSSGITGIKGIELRREST